MEDLFTLGLGCDIAGAYLVAKGLLMSPGEIRQEAKTYGWFNAYIAIARVDGKVAGLIGVGGLIMGFVFQVAGYASVLGTDTTARPSGARAVMSVAATRAGAVLVLGAHQLLKDRLRRAQLIRVAKQSPDGRSQGRPDGSMLATLAEELYGQSRPSDETFQQFAQRILGHQQRDGARPGVGLGISVVS